ncbi:MAG: D-tyrosyl-tRNA(Tyr) deacylase [Candidatus Omnitrophica bacterium]|nr:D-tyrosyl-tRNA(Tyr) deacylase [Candidatus Omnitrophota bacterium]
MKVVVQRVSEAQVSVNDETVGRIGSGLLIFVGIAQADTEEDADYLAQKVTQLRIFEDKDGKMNLSSFDAQAEILVVSQFTLYGDFRKGRRPSFDKAADPQKGEDLYNYFVSGLRGQNIKVETGMFRAMMDVSLVNAGPVTLILESLEK